MLNLNFVDKKRFDRIFEKNIQEYTAYGNLKIPKRYIENIRKNGNRCSFPRTTAEWEYRYTPPDCRSFLITINIANHFLNQWHFATKIIEKNTTVGLLKNEIGIELAKWEITIIYIFWANAKIKIGRKYQNSGIVAAEMIEKAEIYPRKTKMNKNLAKLAFFANKQAYKPVLTKFLEGRSYFFGVNGLDPGIIVHMGNEKARIWEMRFEPELQKRYIEKIKENEGYNIAEIAE